MIEVESEEIYTLHYNWIMTDREIRIDDVSVRFMPVRGYNNYTIDTILLRNTRAINEFIQKNDFEI